MRARGRAQLVVLPLLTGLVFGGTTVQHLFGFTPLRLIGIIGFSAYRWHMPLIYLVLKYPEVSALAPPQRFLSVLWHVIPLLIAMEKPFLLLGRRRPITDRAATPSIIEPAHSPVRDAPRVAESQTVQERIL